MRKDMIRQGDVLVEQVEALPEGCTEVDRDAGRVVLAYGEVTGHAHAFSEPNVTMYEAPAANDNSARKRYIVIKDTPVALRHEEHAPIELKPGTYEVKRQREWSDDDEPIQVAD